MYGSNRSSCDNGCMNALAWLLVLRKKAVSRSRSVRINASTMFAARLVYGLKKAKMM